MPGTPCPEPGRGKRRSLTLGHALLKLMDKDGNFIRLRSPWPFLRVVELQDLGNLWSVTGGQMSSCASQPRPKHVQSGVEQGSSK